MAATILNFNICQGSSCTGLTFSDTTGSFEGGTATGYTNAELAAADQAVLTITMADGTIYTIDLFNIIPGMGFPSNTSTVEYLIPNTDIGLAIGEQLPDQIITFTYTVHTGAVTYTQTITQAFYCQVTCCVNTMFLDIDFECASCNNNSMDNALQAFAMLQGLKYSANCGNITEFNNILTQLNKLCSNTNCSSCN